jgi:hypothetical protein
VAGGRERARLAQDPGVDRAVIEDEDADAHHRADDTSVCPVSSRTYGSSVCGAASGDDTYDAVALGSSKPRAHPVVQSTRRIETMLRFSRR